MDARPYGELKQIELAKARLELEELSAEIAKTRAETEETKADTRTHSFRARFLKSQPDPDFTPEQRATAAKAAGVVVSRGADSRGTFAPGCATSPSDGPEYPQKEDGASTRGVTARTSEAA